MMFFTGMHQPWDAACVPAAFVSIHRLKSRIRGFPARRVVIDSGAFQTVTMHGGYPNSPARYAEELRYWHNKLRRRLLAAVAQDYMCESFVLDITGLTIADHQRLTLERYDALLLAAPPVRIIPVLQGYAPADYQSHVQAYGERLRHRAWVGVGSLCRRNGTPAAVEDVLLAIKAVRPDLRLHGFGLKITALQSSIVRDCLFSADSMAWSFHARKNGRNPNSPIEASHYVKRVATMPVQQHLGVSLFETSKKTNQP